MSHRISIHTASCSLAAAMVLAAGVFCAPALAADPIPAAHQDGIAAMVNDGIILRSDLQRAVAILSSEYQRQQQAIPQDIRTQALDFLIARQLQLEAIKRFNITPNNAVIDRQLLQLAREQGFRDLASFQKSMDNANPGAFAALRQTLIEEASLTALGQSQIAARIKISPQAIHQFLQSPAGQALTQNQYSTIHIRVPYPDDVQRLSPQQKKQAMATALRLRQALLDNQSMTQAMDSARGDYPMQLQGATTGYNPANSLPKQLMPIITALKIGEVSQPIASNNGIEVVKLIDKRSPIAKVLPEWNVSHILLQNDPSQPHAALQQINRIYASLQQGADFAELATKHSQDTVSAKQQGSLGWVSEGELVPEFEAIIKQTAKGDYSTPFQTQFGYHILKVNNVRQRNVSKEYAQKMAEGILFERLAPQAQEDWLDELKSQAYIKIYP